MGTDPDPEPNFSKVGTGINSQGSKFHAYFFDFFLSGNKQLFNHIHTIQLSVVFVRSVSIFPLPVSSARKNMGDIHRLLIIFGLNSFLPGFMF